MFFVKLNFGFIVLFLTEFQPFERSIPYRYAFPLMFPILDAFTFLAQFCCVFHSFQDSFCHNEILIVAFSD